MSRARRIKLAHRIEFGAFRAIESLLSMLSMEDCVSFGREIGHLLHALGGKYRTLVRRNLRIATASDPLPEERLDEMVRETFCRGCANFLASLKTPTLSPAELDELVEGDGTDELTHSYQAGQGLVVTLPHMGNWEALTQLGNTLMPEGATYGGVYRPLNNPLMDELTRQRRTSDGARLFSRKDGFHAPAALLKERGALAILADQRAGARGEAMPFMGKITTCSPLPGLMARRGKARIASLGICTLPNARWRLVMRPVEEDSGISGIMHGLEAVMRESLEDVFWFHDRWRTDSARPLSHYTGITHETAKSATVPLRLLLTTSSNASEEGVQALILRMFEHRPDLHIDRFATPQAESHDDRVVLHDWDPSTPPEQLGALVEKVDNSHPTPLDGGLIFGSERPLGLAIRRFGLKPVIGFDVAGKPWSHSFKTPKTTADWVAIADDMAWVPDKFKK